MIVNAHNAKKAIFKRFLNVIRKKCVFRAKKGALLVDL